MSSTRSHPTAPRNPTRARAARAVFGLSFLAVWSALCFAQDPTEADEAQQQALVASTWSGEVKGFRTVQYLLDGGLLVLKVNDEKPRNEYWAIRAGRFQTRIKLSGQVIVNLDGEFRGDALTGTVVERGDDAVPFQLTRVPKPSPELLASAPPGRPYPPAPKASAKDFEGTYEMALPEKIGVPLPLVVNRLVCKQGACLYTIANDDPTEFKMQGTVRPTTFGQARHALKYAMDRKAEAKAEAPHLAPLLDSGASLAGCIDLELEGMRAPGMVILCKLDRNPWKSPAVLLMGSILSDSCRAASCRYEIIPLVRRR